MSRDYEDKMAGPYSDIETKRVITLEERETEQGDAPCYSEINQDEFSSDAEKLTRETLQFC